MRSKAGTLTIIKQKTIKKTKTNNQKAARMRRQRGYQWEDTLVKRFNSTEKWKAFRLGSPSIALPDVLAVNTRDSILFTIEAKSGTSTSLPVPADQIERCLDWIKTFDIYEKRNVLLAFKFLSKKRSGGLWGHQRKHFYYPRSVSPPPHRKKLGNSRNAKSWSYDGSLGKRLDMKAWNHAIIEDFFVQP